MVWALASETRWGDRKQEGLAGDRILEILMLLRAAITLEATWETQILSLLSNRRDQNGAISPQPELVAALVE